MHANVVYDIWTSYLLVFLVCTIIVEDAAYVLIIGQKLFAIILVFHMEIVTILHKQLSKLFYMVC